jgi:hypothetical protein
MVHRTGNQLKLGLLSQNLMSSTVIAVFLVLPGIFASVSQTLVREVTIPLLTGNSSDTV